jgi:hypothetical protein
LTRSIFSLLHSITSGRFQNGGRAIASGDPVIQWSASSKPIWCWASEPAESRRPSSPSMETSQSSMATPTIPAAGTRWGIGSAVAKPIRP